MQKKYFYKKYKIKLRQNFIIYDLSTCGFYQIRSITNNYLQFFNFESLRRLLSRKIKKKMNFILLKNSNKIPTFKKPLKVRMGSGKGSFNTWLWKFQKFQKIFEISFFLKYFLIKKYLIKIKKKIPFKIYFSTR